MVTVKLQPTPRANESKFPGRRNFHHEYKYDKHLYFKTFNHFAQKIRAILFEVTFAAFIINKQTFSIVSSIYIN